MQCETIFVIRQMEDMILWNERWNAFPEINTPNSQYNFSRKKKFFLRNSNFYFSFLPRPCFLHFFQPLFSVMMANGLNTTPTSIPHVAKKYETKTAYCDWTANSGNCPKGSSDKTNLSVTHFEQGRRQYDVNRCNFRTTWITCDPNF